MKVSYNAVSIASCSSCENALQVLQQDLPCNAVPSVYPWGILKATPTNSSGTALYESYVACQRNLNEYTRTCKLDIA